MRIAFLTQDLQLSGGVGVVVEHATQLARRGFEVDLVLAGSPAAGMWAHAGLESLSVLALEQAYERRYDVALATWWETTEQLFELDAARHACFVQSLEDRFYGAEDPRRIAAALAQDLPVRFVTEARWIAATLEALRPGERVFYVRNGIAKRDYAPLDAVPVAGDGPLRILIEGSARVPFKGVADALAAAAAMNEQRHVTVVAPDGSGAGLDGADRAVGPLGRADMAALYAQSDVVLKLSRVEGMFGVPLEGFHRGATCVVTPVTGHEEYVEHGENGLVVDWDDRAGTARALDLLARDRAVLHRLRCGALATARAWPSWEQQGEVMAAALRALRRQPPPDARGAGRRLGRDLGATLAEGERLAIELATARRTAAGAQGSRAYRLAVRSRTTLDRIRRAPGRRLRRWRGLE
jgi:glycosyltransferase involved in cell wall biosynthesis